VGNRFDRSIVVRLRYAYHLKDRFSRLRAAGLMTMEEMASKLDVLPCTVKIWRERGLLRAHRYNDKKECLYESPYVLLPRTFAHKLSYLAAKEEVAHPLSAGEFAGRRISGGTSARTASPALCRCIIPRSRSALGTHCCRARPWPQFITCS
jgi:hypothetical protein